MDYTSLNQKLFRLLSCYLNFSSDALRSEMVNELVKNHSVREDEAVKILFASLLGLDILNSPEDKIIYHEYFPLMLKKLDVNKYASDDYYQTIHFKPLAKSAIEFKDEEYSPYEMFVYDDIEKTEDGKLIPKVGYFSREFVYPTILENGQNWMSVTPNEVETMRQDISSAFGRVVTFGLGLGYFAFMASNKKEVDSVTIVELNKAEIDLFNNYILPQFPHKEKIQVIQADAYKFAEKNYPKKMYDYVYVDIWHDVGDGIPMYEKMKSYEKLNPSAVYRYWIEKSMKCYLE